MNKYVRKAVLLLLVLFLWTIHGFQWRQPPQLRCRHRRNEHHSLVAKPRVAPKLQYDDSNGDYQKNVYSFVVPRILLTQFQSFSRLWASTNASAASLNVEEEEEEEEEDVSFANQTQSELIAKAEELRAKAQAVRAEAQAMEAALQETNSKRQKAKLAEIDGIIATLFSTKLFASKGELATSSNVKRNQTTDSLTSTTLIPDARVVADRLQNGRYSQEQILAVVDRLFNLQAQAAGQVVTVETIPPFPTDSYDIVIQTENSSEQFGDYLEALTQATNILDDGTAALQDQLTFSMSSSDSMSTSGSNSRSSTVSKGDGRLEIAIRTRIKELRKIQDLKQNRLLAADISKVVSAVTNGTVEEYIRQTFGLQESEIQELVEKKLLLQNSTTGEIAPIPIWVPSTLLPYIVATNVSTIGPTEIKLIEKEVLLGSRFFLTKTESVPGAALFRGNIRMNLGKITSSDSSKASYFDNTTAEVFAELQDRLEAVGLGDRVQLFLMADLDAEPRMQGTRPAMAAMEEEPKPVLLAVSKSVTPDESLLTVKKSWIKTVGKQVSYPLTALSIFYYSISMHALNPNFFDALVKRRDLTALYTCIPVALGTVLLQTIHEVAHYLVAKRKQIKIGPPVPIPSFHLTLFPFFGCITPLRSFPKNRAALLDFALSGPLSALAASLALVIGGALLTVRASPFQLAQFPVMSVAKMKSSFLLGSILSWLAPKTMMLPLAQPVPMHPLFVVGASGLIYNALNLLPIFRLDGGRACFAAMGQRQGAVISVFSLLLMVSMVLSGASSIFMSWTFLVVLLQRRQEIPPRDDVTEVDGKRLTLWLLSFLLCASILAPFPGFRLLAM
ncbi:peptidase M50 family protein [Nitzschia inconspicua]|uniref:Peptidase M50 family protein n=1 Tax=Nitzschia inconspicua TaxID=303405 RepID=A0A9K3Q872_9STRA|nr:peptidase M50 family protein [Nitzschia inconspicua]